MNLYKQSRGHGFSIRDSFKEAYGIIKEKFWIIIGQYAILTGLLVVCTLLTQHVRILQYIFAALYSFLSISLAFRYVAHKEVTMEDVLNTLTFRKFSYYVVSVFLSGMAVIVTSIPLLALAFRQYLRYESINTLEYITRHPLEAALFFVFLIPLSMVLVRVSFVKYVSIARDVTPIDAIRISNKMTKGYRRHFFIFLILCALLNIAAALALFVGVLFTLPLTAITTVLVYKKITKGESEAEVVEDAPVADTTDDTTDTETKRGPEVIEIDIVEVE